MTIGILELGKYLEGFTTANGSTQYIGQDVGIVVGKTYKITYTVITNTLSNDRL